MEPEIDDDEEEEEEEEEKREIGIDEDYPGVKNTGLLGRVVRTLSYLTWGN